MRPVRLSRYLRVPAFVFVYLRLNLAAAMEYRAAFISQVIGMILNDSIMIVFWYLFFRQFPQVAGWGLADVLRLWAIVAVSFGLGTAIFGHSVRLPTLIANGQLDYYLALPRNVLLHVLVSRSSTSAWGDVAFGLIAFVATGDGSPGAIALFITLALLGCAVFVAYNILVGSLAFWLGNAETLANQAGATLVNFSTYPGSIFQGWVKVLTFTLIPAAALGHVPVALLRHFDPLVFAGLVVFGIALTTLAVLTFRLGLRRYESGNLLVMRG